jgi:hypothetical protein
VAAKAIRRELQRRGIPLGPVVVGRTIAMSIPSF